ncbi:APC family permease [Hamadaea tsunoensis]|uniref:APC family permease n=1 Tax=Hamadaea tsunoensis TaxID=53368 RepID=UPI000A062684|nr:amino acid permease [Hamadaea tsunoensis]
MTLDTRHRLGLAEGTALYAGAVLGPGVLALPSLGARAAGPASLLAWAAMLLLSGPVALAFAALGARFPDGGGVAAFAGRAFGVRVAAMVGWWFAAAVPMGVLAGAIIGGEYVATTLGGGGGTVLPVAAGLLLTAFGANYAGLRVSGRLQVFSVSLLVVLLLTAITAALPAARAANFHPFAPHGWPAVATAASVLFYAFAGWEAASHLSAEFRDPRRHIIAATGLTLALVSVLYLGLAGTVFGVLGDRAGATDVPLTLLFERGLGPATRAGTAAVAVLLTLGAVNTYIAGGARLVAALGRAGALPRRLSGDAGSVPRRGVVAQLAACGLTGAASLVWHLDLTTLMRATSACLAAVSATGLLAAVRLLPRGGPLWWSAVVGSGFTVAVLACCGVLLVVPVVLGVAALAVATPWRREPGPRPQEHGPGPLLSSPSGSSDAATSRAASRRRNR